MADRKITALTELTAPVATDVFPIIDISESDNANKNKKIQLTTILRGIPNGTASAPSVGFIDDTGTSGLFRVTDDEIGISCNQTQVASFAAAGPRPETCGPAKAGRGSAGGQSSSTHLFGDRGRAAGRRPRASGGASEGGRTQAAGQGGWRRGRDVPDPRRRGAFGLAFAGSRRAAALRPAGRPWCGARADRARHFPALRGVAMAKDRSEPDLDRELADLPPELRWREWMRRIEAVLFASASPVPREDLVRVVGQGVSVDLLVEDLAADLEGRAFEVAQVAGGWIFRTRPAYAPAIRAAADVGDQLLELSEFDVAVLAAIAYHQPITRDGLKDIFGKEISRDLIGRLHARDLIGTGPRSPRRGAPYSFVTTEQFLIAFGLESLRDLPDREQLDDAGLVVDV